jgi:hypothetical protein
MMRSLALLGIVAACAMGCSIESEDGKYREPLPEQGSVSLRLPGSSGSTSTSSVRILSGTGGSSGGGVTSSDAEFYSFSREITDSIDGHTAVVLAVVWAVVSNPATKVEARRATWGPYHGNALEPVVWRLVVDEVGTNEYDYSLEGRSRASTSDADYRAVLKGHGYGKADARHNEGWFQWDADVARALDPSTAKDSGTAKVDYDLRQFPKTIKVALRPTDGTGQVDAEVEHQPQGAGILSLTAHADVEEDGQKDGKLEDITLKSQWNATGAGRADVQIAGGSLPIASVAVVECWNSSFALAYYKDSVNIKPTSGAADSCPSF